MRTGAVVVSNSPSSPPSCRPSRPAPTLSPRKREIPPTTFTPPAGQVAAATLAKRPTRFARALRYLANLRQSTPKERLRATGYLVCAADLLQHARRQGITHIHAHSCANSAHIVALCHLLGGPTYSLSLHGDLPVYGKDHASKMARATFVTADGSHLKNQLMEQVGVPEEKIFVTCMGVNTQEFFDAGLHSQTPNKLHLYTIARLNLVKGHRFALGAMRRVLDQHPDIDLTYTIVGDGAYRPEIEADIKRLNLEDRVKLVGSLSEEACIKLHQQADVFVLPSVGLGEAWPVAVMDAMACAVPVVCSIIGATTEMITNGVNGLLTEQADEAALAACFVKLARDPAERRRLGDAARHRAVTYFDCNFRAGLLLQAIQTGKPPVISPQTA